MLRLCFVEGKNRGKENSGKKNKEKMKNKNSFWQVRKGKGKKWKEKRNGVKSINFLPLQIGEEISRINFCM